MPAVRPVSGSALRRVQRLHPARSAGGWCLHPAPSPAARPIALPPVRPWSGSPCRGAITDPVLAQTALWPVSPTGPTRQTAPRRKSRGGCGAAAAATSQAGRPARRAPALTARAKPCRPAQDQSPATASPEQRGARRPQPRVSSTIRATRVLLPASSSGSRRRRWRRAIGAISLTCARVSAVSLRHAA